MKFLKRLAKVVKILVGAYRAGHEAGLWTEGPTLPGTSKPSGTETKLLDKR